MEIQISNDHNRKIIQNSINRILDNCDDELKVKIENYDFIITDENDAESYIPETYTQYEINLFIKTYFEGLGGVIGSLLIGENKKHLVVISIKNCFILKLNDNQIDGTIAHELGHIFNDYIELPIPSVLNGATFSEINETKLNNQKNKEFYADYFSVMVNCQEGLTKSIKVFLDSELSTNEDIFILRLEQLNLGTIFQERGRLKPIVQ